MELGGWKYIANIVTLTFLRFWVRKCYKNQEKQSFSCSLVPWLHIRRNRAVYIHWGIVRSGNQSSWLVPVHRFVIDCKQAQWSIGASIWKKKPVVSNADRPISVGNWYKNTTFLENDSIPGAMILQDALHCHSLTVQQGISKWFGSFIFWCFANVVFSL